MSKDKEYKLGKWMRQPPNSHFGIEILGYDNGDGDGPHYFNLVINGCNGPAAIEFTVNSGLDNIYQLKDLSEAFNKAYYEAQRLCEENEARLRRNA